MLREGYGQSGGQFDETLYPNIPFVLPHTVHCFWESFDTAASSQTIAQTPTVMMDINRWNT